MPGETLNTDDNVKSRFEELAATVDEETEFWSGGFERHEGFPKIVEMGEQAIPLILGGLAEFKDGEDMRCPWWRIQAINTILHSQGKPVIHYPPEASGRLQAVREITLEWGAKAGYSQSTGE